MVDKQPNNGEQQPNSKGFNEVPKTMIPAKKSHHSLKSTHNGDTKHKELKIQ